MDEKQYDICKKSILDNGAEHRVFTVEQRSSLRWFIYDDLLQNYIQKMWTPETTTDELISLSVELDRMTDLDLIDRYSDVLNGMVYADREGVYTYLNKFPEPVNAYFKYIYSENEKQMTELLNFKDMSEFIDFVEKDGEIGRFG